MLQRLEFTAFLRQAAYPWLDHTILATLIPDAAPALTEIIVTFPTAVIESELPPGLDSNFLHALDAALVVHPVAPSITWRLDIPIEDPWRLDVPDEDRYLDLTDFAALMQREMPTVDANGRLFITQFVSQSTWHDGLAYAV